MNRRRAGGEDFDLKFPGGRPSGLEGRGFLRFMLNVPDRSGSLDANPILGHGLIMALQGCQKIPTLTNQRVGHPEKQTQLLCVDHSSGRFVFRVFLDTTLAYLPVFDCAIHTLIAITKH